MAESQTANSPFQMDHLGLMIRREDFALGLMAILVVLIVPMPKMLLDLSLVLSITFSAVLLITSPFIQKLLEHSFFLMTAISLAHGMHTLPFLTRGQI